jgi:uncharacterized protein (TIGR03000 family)
VVYSNGCHGCNGGEGGVIKEKEKKDKKFPPPPGSETATPARITVRLPADAKLWVDDTHCPLTSDVRAFNTPNLQPGRQYFYTLRLEVNRDGQTLTLSRRIHMTAGQSLNVDLNDLSTATALR